MADTDSSASTMIVALVAIIVIVAMGFFLYRTINGSNTGTPGADINVTLPGSSTEGGQ